jgi:hypothetical protein
MVLTMKQAGSACYQLLTGFLLGLIFNHEDRGNLFLQKKNLQTYA